jgi:hypothetical protein
MPGGQSGVTYTNGRSEGALWSIASGMLKLHVPCSVGPPCAAVQPCGCAAVRLCCTTGGDKAQHPRRSRPAKRSGQAELSGAVAGPRIGEA